MDDEKEKAQEEASKHAAEKEAAEKQSAEAEAAKNAAGEGVDRIAEARAENDRREKILDREEALQKDKKDLHAEQMVTGRHVPER